MFQLTSQSIQGEQIILKISFDHCKVPWPLMGIWVFGTMEINYMNKITPRHRDWELGKSFFIFFLSYWAHSQNGQS